MTWLSCPSFAELAGISRQKAHKALSQGRWRGVPLAVQTMEGRGGKAGKSYIVRLDSLPEALQARWRADHEGERNSLQIVEGPAHGAVWDFEHIRPALDAPRGSKERARIVKELAATPYRRANGKMTKASLRSINRWIADYEAHGLAGLARQKRADAGAKRAVIFRPFDAWLRAAAGEKALADAERVLHEMVCGCHKDHTPPKLIKRYAEGALSEFCQSLKLEPPQAAIHVPLHFINAPERRRVRLAATFLKDRKRYEDNNRPRIRRNIDGMSPMDAVEGDVHPLDFYLGDRGHLQQYAKAICWLDVATKRLWVDVVLLPKGEGVRNEHVISSFVRMCLAWGLPRVLRIDNGSEYRFADMLEDLFKLHPMGLNTRLGGRDAGVSRAKAYNAPAKQIEGVFRTLERYLSPLPGYVGGDRMKPKVVGVGRKLAPFSGSAPAFDRMIQNTVALYNSMEQGKRSQLKGRSPMEAFRQALESGWCKTEVDPDAFSLAFSQPVTRQLRQGSFDYGGHSWTCPELQSHTAERVVPLIPKFHDYDRLPVRDENGKLIGIAERQQSFGYLDVGGARISERAARRHKRATLAQLRGAPTFDAGFLQDAAAARLPPPPEAPVGARITASDQARALGAALKESPQDRRRREIEERERETHLLAAAREGIIHRSKGAA